MNNKTKIRIRSDKELNLRKKGLFEIKKIFEENNIPFFLWGGLLLGIKRDNNFIKWDWDVELGLFSSDLKANWKKIVRLLKENDFEIIEKDLFNLKIEFIKYCKRDVTIYSLVGWRYDFFSGCYIRKKLIVPKFYFSKLYKISFQNKKFLCPGPISEFLRYFYGDWKTPKKTSNKKDYLSKKINNNNLWKIYTLIDKIKYRIFNVQK